MYNKIFTKILDSSIWLETDSTRIVWLTLIAAMDEDGFAQFASISNLAHRARVSEEAGIAAVNILQSPDRDSGDPDNDGRRIERVPGGWMILNAAKYREIVTRAVSQEKTRQRVARFRAKNNDVTPVTDGNAGVTPVKRSVTPSEADTEAGSYADIPIADGSANGGSQEAPKGGVSKAPRPRDPLFDALAEADGSNPQQLTRSAARAIGVALAEIRRVCPDLTPAEIMRRMGHYRLLMPNVRPTATGLAKHWARCDTEPESIEQKGFGFAR